MNKFCLSWKDFQKNKEKSDNVLALIVFLLCLYFFGSLVSFIQLLQGKVLYSSFWHTPWRWILNILF